MKHPQAIDHEQRCMVMASIPRPSLVALIKDHVLRENGHLTTPDLVDLSPLPWIESMVKGRFFCAGDDLVWDGSPSAAFLGMSNTQNNFAMGMKKERLDAFFSFMDGVEFSQAQNDPLHGALKRQPIVASLRVSDAFRDVFRQVVLQMVEDDVAFERVSAPSLALKKGPGRSPMGMSTSQVIQRESMFSKALSAICALGMPDLVAPVVERCPNAIGKHQDIDQSQWQSYIRSPAKFSSISVSPAFFAVQFSQTDCLKALLKSGVRASSSVAKVNEKASKGGDSISLDLQSLWIHFKPSCLPSSFETALELATKTAMPDFNLSKKLENCTSPSDDFHDLSFHLTAFMNKGHMDLGRTDPVMNSEERASAAQHVKNACLYGYPEVVDHFKGRVPWDLLVPDLTAEQIEDEEPGDRKRGPSDFVYMLCESPPRMYPQPANSGPPLVSSPEVADALSHLLEHAREVGEQSIFKPFSFHNGHNVEPVQAMIDSNAQGPMLSFLKNGLDPNEPFRKDGRTPLVHATVQDKPEMVHLLRSFSARKTVHSLLDDIENETKSEMAP